MTITATDVAVGIAPAETSVDQGGRDSSASPVRPAQESAEVRFRSLYKANYEPLLSYALRRCGDVAEAHDITADTFLVLWRRFAEAPVDEEVPLWLYGVARRIVANKYRSRLRANRLVGRLGHVRPELSSTEKRAEQREEANAVLRSLQRLKDNERELLLLAAWERLSASEIAIVLGCSPNAAAIRLHRARKRLADVYEKELSRRGHD